MSMMDLHWKPPRIRLLFEDPGMLSKAQVDQGLAKSWYLVTADSLSIAHLAARIARDYWLGDSCPQGLVLEMRGFVLPTGQSVRILQDSDLVRVRRKHERVSRVQSRELRTNSLSVDNEEIDHEYRIDRGGLLAIDEFGKEPLGYQGELSNGDAELSLSFGKEMQSALDERKRSRALESSGTKRKRPLHIDSHTQNNLLVLPPKPRVVAEGIASELWKSKKSSGKKKHDKIARADRGSSQIVSLELSMLEGLPRSEHIDRDVSAKPEKKKKKKNRELVEQAGSDVNCAGTSPANEANAQEAMPGKRRKVIPVEETANPEKPAEIDQKLKPESSRKGEKLRKRQDTNHDNHETEVLNERSYGNGLMIVNDEVVRGTPGISLTPIGNHGEAKGNNGSPLSNETAPEQPNTAEKRPSRSARRKKAKRRWLREHGQDDIVPKKDDAKTQLTEPKDQTDTSGSETSEAETESEAEAEAEAQIVVEAAVETEAEAEEEILPRICAPGHIRFEHVEDARTEGRCTAPVLFSYTEVHCKKQGQAWGQGKSRGRYSEDVHNRNGKMENRPSEGTVEPSPSEAVVADKIDFEKLPLLSRIPVVGDLLAYQLVELTPSWTPELSSYRVGKVSVYDGVSKMITLEPVPEYPIHVQQIEDEVGSLNEDLFLPPYTSDGTLEVNLSTLMELRVVEAGPVQVNCQSQEPPDVNATAVDVPITSPQSETVPQEPVQPTAASTADNAPSDEAELRAVGGNEGGEVGRSLTTEPQPVLEQSTNAGWQEMLSQEIINKKRELSLKASKELGGQNGDGPASVDAAKTRSSQVRAVETSKRNPGVPGAPIIRHRYMRTGALGPTMALLRASQNL